MNITASQVPKIVDLIDRLNYPDGSNATITCTIASGDLEDLKYDWYRDKQRITDGSALLQNRMEISVLRDNFQSILRIFNLEPEDEGLYTCVARNRFGQNKMSTQLQVKGKSQTFLCCMIDEFHTLTHRVPGRHSANEMEHQAERYEGIGRETCSRALLGRWKTITSHRMVQDWRRRFQWVHGARIEFRQSQAIRFRLL